MHAQRNHSRDAGFSLIELMVALAIVMVVMGATMTALTNAYRSNTSAKNLLGVNNNLRTALDIVVRDMIQVGQGLPTGRTIMVPNGAGQVPINRPHPEGGTCTEWPDDMTNMPAVTAGPGCGPVVDNVPTDVITTLAGDSTFESVPINAFNLGAHTATVSTSAMATGGVDISTGGPDDVRVGDLIMFIKGSASALVYVTAVDGNQTFTFDVGDPMNLNQFDAALNGTLDDLANAAPTAANSARATRIRMISYYIDNTLDPDVPRLTRHINWGDPLVANNLRGRTVAFGVENLQLSYDMVDGATNPSNVRMIAADLTTGGACAPNACSPNQIRKLNVFVAARSEGRQPITNRLFRNSLSTQVSLRSLALVDRYR